MDVGSVFLGTGADPNSWSEPLNSIWRRSLLLWHVIGKSCKKQGLMWGDKVSLGPVIRLADGWPKPMAPQKTTTWHENASGNNGIVKKANTKTKHSDIFGQNFTRGLEDKHSAHWGPSLPHRHHLPQTRKTTTKRKQSRESTPKGGGEKANQTACSSQGKGPQRAYESSFRAPGVGRAIISPVDGRNTQSEYSLSPSN